MVAARQLEGAVRHRLERRARRGEDQHHHHRRDEGGLRGEAWPAHPARPGGRPPAAQTDGERQGGRQDRGDEPGVGAQLGQPGQLHGQAVHHRRQRPAVVAGLQVGGHQLPIGAVELAVDPARQQPLRPAARRAAGACQDRARQVVRRRHRRIGERLQKLPAGGALRQVALGAAPGDLVQGAVQQRLQPILELAAVHPQPP